MTRKVKISHDKDTGDGILHIQGQGRYEVTYTLAKEQRIISRPGLGTAGGRMSITGTVTLRDGSLLPLNQHPVEGFLILQNELQLPISIDQGGSFTGA